MKRIFLLLAVVCLCLPMLAQEINSFRYLSTGGALEDDADLALSPINLSYIKGTKFFSNLSNFGGSDKILMNSGSNQLMIGVVTDLMFLSNMKIALIHQYYDNKYPRSITFSPDFTYTDFGLGEVEYTWQSYQDSNMNGLYDMYQKLYQKYMDVDTSTGDVTYANFSYKLKEIGILGFRLGLINNSDTYTSAINSLLGFNWGSPTTQLVYTTQSLQAMDPTVTDFLQVETKRGTFNTEYQTSIMTADFAFAKNIEPMELAAILSLNTFEYIYDGKDKAEESLRTVIGEVETQSSEKATNDEYTKQEGAQIGLDLRIRTVIIPALERKNEGYMAIGGGMRFNSYDVSSDNKETYYADYPGDYDEFWTMGNVEDGTAEGMNMNVYYKMNLPLNQKTNFGIGYFYNYYTYNESSSFERTYTSLYTDYSEPEVWTHKALGSWKIEGDTKYEFSENLTTIPVGIEYWFTPNNQWAMRFGSSFNQYSRTINRTYKPTQVDPMMTTVTYSDGSDPYISFSENSYTIESENSKSRSSNTDYSFGLCFRPNRNLQIDLMGVFDNSNTDLWNTEFFRNLKLSFTIGF